MTRRRAAIRVASVAAIGAIALAACGSSGSSSSSGGSKSGTSTSSSSSLIPTNEVRTSDTKGGTLNLGFQDDFDSLDGARMYYAVSWNFARYYLRTPLTFKPQPGDASTQLTGDLATAPAVGQDNNTVWTYHLKKGIKFEDGTPITSADIK
ncbi:MAG: ABC transporter substrate-binding protein [Frankia sp.]